MRLDFRGKDARNRFHQATHVMPRSGYSGSIKLLIKQSVSAAISVRDRSNNASTCAKIVRGSFCFKQLHRFCPKKKTYTGNPNRVGRPCSLLFQFQFHLEFSRCTLRKVPACCTIVLFTVEMYLDNGSAEPTGSQGPIATPGHWGIFSSNCGSFR